jgi:hypothetical protein
MAISYGTPDSRLDNFTWPHLNFDIKHFTVGNEEEDPEKLHYVYICKKLPGADVVCETSWPATEEFLRKAYSEDPEPEEAETTSDPPAESTIDTEAPSDPDQVSTAN